MLNHYRRLLALRRSLPVLRTGDIELLDAPAGVLRYSRSMPEAGDHRTPRRLEVAVNFTGRPASGAHEPGRWIGGTTWPPPPTEHADGTLAPDEACVVAL